MNGNEKLLLEVVEIWLELMTEEELLHFCKRLEIYQLKWKPKSRGALHDLLSAELARRSPTADFF